MNHTFNSFALWLADYYLLSTMLLALVLAALAMVRQPVRRLAIVKSTLVALPLLAALLALPGWSVIHLLSEGPATPLLDSASPFSQPSGTEYSVLSTAGKAAPETMPEPVTESPPQHAPAAAPVPIRFPVTWQAALAAVHLFGAGCVVIWLSLGFAAARRLRKTALPASSALQSLFDEVANGHNHNTRVARPESSKGVAAVVSANLLTSDRINVAVAIGMWQPAILLPENWPKSKSPDELRMILAHEWAHLHHRDLHWLAVSRAFLLALWAQPLYWILRRVLRLAQEALADAAAAELSGRHSYAERLVAWARDVRRRPATRLSSAVGLWEGPSQLRQRIAILLNERFTMLRNCSRRWRLATALLAIGTATALSMMTLQPTTRADEKSPPVESPPAVPSQVAPNKQSDQSMLRPKPNTIAGRVMDENGQPVAGAEAFLFRINRIDSSRKLQAKTATDAEGKYRFENVIDVAKEFPDGKLSPLNMLEEEFVQVFVRAPGRVAGMGMDMRQLIARSGKFFDMTLKPAATLSGRVSGLDGKPVSGARVMVGASGFTTWEEVASARTKADGSYQIDDAPPSSMEEYRKKEAEQRRSMNALRSGNEKTFSHSTYVVPPVVTVEHPDFAVKRALYEKIPGTQDVKLEPAAIVEGRVVFGDSRKPAAGAVVHLATSRSDNTLPTSEQSMSLVYAEARTDAEGKYRFASLPAGNYVLSAEMPDWVNVGIDAFTAPVGKTSTAPNLVLTQGGIISIRLIDDKTGKPIALTPDVRADISAHQFPLITKGINRPNWKPNAAANSVGRFEVHALPGKRAVMVMGVVHVGEKPAWAAKTSPGELKLPVVDVVDGKTVEVDIPVVSVDKPPITGRVQVGPTPATTQPANDDQGKRQNGATIQLVQNKTVVADRADVKRPPAILSYGDGKADGKKSYGGSGHLIRFELPEGVTKVRGLRIHGSRYGLPEAPKEDFEITFLNEDGDETLHSEAAPYHLFKRGKEQNWTRVMFDKEVELPKKFWISLNFNPHQTKGVYLSYDTSTNGEHSRVGLPGDEDEPKETDFGGDWMVQVMLAKPEK